MSTDTMQTAINARNEVLATFCQAARDTVARYTEVCASGENRCRVAIVNGGGLALVWVPSEEKFRLGSPRDKNIAVIGGTLSSDLVYKWNRKNPNHAVYLTTLGEALQADLMSIMQAIALIEKNIEKSSVAAQLSSIG